MSLNAREILWTAIRNDDIYILFIVATARSLVTFTTFTDAPTRWTQTCFTTLFTDF